MINYYFVCQRKLWLFANQLQFEDNSETVRLGKILDETAYVKSEKHVMIDNVINIDMIQHWQVIHEIKHSHAINTAAEWQLKYYIYYLRSKGIEIKHGVIDYPLLKRRVKISYSDKDQYEISQILKQIKTLLSLKRAPKVNRKPICKTCAYYEYCFS